MLPLPVLEPPSPVVTSPHIIYKEGEKMARKETIAHTREGGGKQTRINEKAAAVVY